MPDNVPTWDAVATQMPSGANDALYDLTRQRYFTKYVVPWAQSRGHNIEAAREEFLKLSERKGKLKYPRINLLGAKTVEAAVRPLRPLVGEEVTGKLTEGVKEAIKEAKRQGITTWPYEMAGQVAGEIPYFLPFGRVAKGVRAASTLGRRAGYTLPKISKKVSEAIAVGTLQGTYDAASADQGERLVSGAVGAVIGAAAVGAFNGLGSLSRTLRRKHSLTIDEAESIAKAATGTADDVERAVAAKVAQSDPAVNETIKQQVASQVKTADKIGRPRGRTSATSLNKNIVQFKLRGADGREHTWPTEGFKITNKNLEEVMVRVQDHLKYGTDAAIIDITGEPRNVNRIMKALEKASIDSGDLQIPLVATPAEDATVKKVLTRTLRPNETRKSGPQPVAVTQHKPRKLSARKKRQQARQEPKQVGVPPAVVSPPQVPATATAPPPVSVVGAVTKAAKDLEVTHLRDLPKTARVQIDKKEIPVFDLFEELPDGRIRAKITRETYDDLQDALDMYDVRYSARDPVEVFTRRERGPIEIEGQTPALGRVSPSSRALRVVFDEGIPGSPGADAVSVGRKPGLKPVEFYKKFNRTNVFHESLHSGFSFLGLRPIVKTMFEGDEMVRSVRRAFSTETRVLYKKTWGEETYVHIAEALRTNNTEKLEAFRSYDGSMEEFMTWFADRTRSLLDHVAREPDSLHKRVMERQLNNLLVRSDGNIQALSNRVGASLGYEIRWSKGAFEVEHSDGTIRRFTKREELADFIDSELAEPFNSRNLVDESSLPDYLPRFNVEDAVPPPSIWRAPIQTDIPPPRGGTELGFSLLSRAFRPFFPWLDTVARKLDRRDLYIAFKDVDKNVRDLRLFTGSYERKLDDILGSYPTPRKSDLFHYFSDPTDEATSAMRITAKEKKDIVDLREIADTLRDQFGGVSVDSYLKTYRGRALATGYKWATEMYRGKQMPDNVKFWYDLVHNQHLDPRDTNLHRVFNAYLQGGARKRFLSEPLEKARKLVNGRNPDGTWALGAVRTTLNRHVGYLQGQPDSTHTAIQHAVRSVVGMVNDVVNKTRGSLGLDPVKFDDKEVLARWTLFSYSGALGLRPMVAFRDSLQIFITSGPILGKYIEHGMTKMFKETPAAFKRAGSLNLAKLAKANRGVPAFDIPLKYGALLEYRPLRPLYEVGQGDVVTAGGKFTRTVTRFAEKSLIHMQIANNSNRLPTFWGHVAKTEDAFKAFRRHGDQRKFANDSSFIFLDEIQKNEYLKELPGLLKGKKADVDDFLYRTSAELVDLSQWAYRRGNSPGLYEYEIGRMFGQYGTWPLNYIEYARRLWKVRGEPEGKKAFIRLALYHGAVISAGDIVGVDTATWAFTQPTAYGGGPLFNAVTSIAEAAGDWETFRGPEARRKIIRPIWPLSVPGGLAIENLTRAILTDDEDLWLRVLGFVPMKEGEQDKGVHAIVPP